MPLIDPQSFKTKDMQGVEHEYLISKIPASYSKEIVLQYPTSALPKVGDAALHMKITLQMMTYVGIPRGPGVAPLILETRELCDNHIPDLRTWMAVEREIARYNWGFFLPEDLSLFWGQFKRLLMAFNQETSTDSSPLSSPLDAQPS